MTPAEQAFWEQSFYAALSGLVNAAVNTEDKPHRAAMVADDALVQWRKRFANKSV